MNRLLGILQSKWTTAFLFAALVVAGMLRDERVWCGVFILFTVCGIALIASSIPLFRQLRRAWKDFPATPEYEQYARRKAAERKANDKNKIELE